MLNGRVSVYKVDNESQIGYILGLDEIKQDIKDQKTFIREQIGIDEEFERDIKTQKIFMREQLLMDKEFENLHNSQHSINDILKNMITEVTKCAWEEDSKLAEEISKLNKKCGRLKKVMVGLVFMTTILTGFMVYFGIVYGVLINGLAK